MSASDEYVSACEESKGNAAMWIEKIINTAGFYCKMSIRVYCKDRYMYVDVFPNPFKHCDPYCDEGCVRSRFSTFQHVIMRISRRLVVDPSFGVNPALISVGVVRNGGIDYVPIVVPLNGRDVVGDLMDMDVLMLRFELVRLSVSVPKIDLSRFWRGALSDA